MGRSDYDSGSHQFNPEDFEPGSIHQLKKDAKLFGERMAPAIALINPKYPHNVAGAVRAASCFGAKAVIFSGSRCPILGGKNFRLPRELRLRDYYDVRIINDDYLFNRFDRNIVPVAIELMENSESLTTFEHPEHALYVFGPEDGSIDREALKFCRRFVSIPSKHCLNLSNAVNVVMYDRILKKCIIQSEEILNL